MVGALQNHQEWQMEVVEFQTASCHHHLCRLQILARTWEEVEGEAVVEGAEEEVEEAVVREPSEIVEAQEACLQRPQVVQMMQAPQAREATEGIRLNNFGERIIRKEYGALLTRLYDTRTRFPSMSVLLSAARAREASDGVENVTKAM